MGKRRGLTKQQKAVWMVAITALVGIVFGLPFTLIHPVLPFVVVSMGIGLALMMQRWRWLSKTPKTYFAGCLVALVLLLPAASLVNFVEQGFDDGPFYGTTHGTFIAGEQASDRLAYRQGELLVYNRQPGQAPVLVYRVEGDARWAIVMDIHQNPRFEGYHLSAIESPQLVHGVLRDRLDFLATWSFGVERGRAYIWKWGGFHRFFLSW
jgi:hypothetical protein